MNESMSRDLYYEVILLKVLI